MDLPELNRKWQNVAEFKKDFKALRISSECIPELYLALDKEGKRCLILFLPSKLVTNLRKVQKENLTIEYLEKDKAVIIRLNDYYFTDLFNELILSLYLRIANLSNAVEYTKELISSFYKWLEFFDEKHNFQLSKEEIKGLIGELFILNKLINNNSGHQINNFLEAWKGPFDTSNDFIFSDKNLEIKTKEESSNYIKISSEYQLESEKGKGLELIVVNLKPDFVEGQSLHEWILNILNLIRSNLGEVSIFFKALKQKGLTTENSKEYNNYKYKVLDSERFDCTAPNFPKIIRSTISPQLSHITYKIRVSSIEEFLLDKI